MAVSPVPNTCKHTLRAGFSMSIMMCWPGWLNFNLLISDHVRCHVGKVQSAKSRRGTLGSLYPIAW